MHFLTRLLYWEHSLLKFYFVFRKIKEKIESRSDLKVIIVQVKLSSLFFSYFFIKIFISYFQYFVSIFCDHFFPSIYFLFFPSSIISYFISLIQSVFLSILFPKNIFHPYNFFTFPLLSFVSSFNVASHKY